MKSTAKQGFDALLWQTLASVLIPGQVIHGIVAFVGTAAKMSANPRIPKWTPTGAGLVAIPFIIHPIDHLVTVLLDHTTRKWIGTE